MRARDHVVLMDSMKSTDAKNSFGLLLDKAQLGPVAITTHGRTIAIVMSAHA